MFPETLPCQEKCPFNLECGIRLVMNSEICKEGLKPLTSAVKMRRDHTAIYYKSVVPDTIYGVITDDPLDTPMCFLLANPRLLWTEILQVRRGEVLTPPSEIVDKIINLKSSSPKG